jgi:tetratricopeptide (TPR) repeat protein
MLRKTLVILLLVLSNAPPGVILLAQTQSLQELIDRHGSKSKPLNPIQARREAAKLNNKAMELSNNGMHSSALKHLKEAYRLLPDSDTIARNLVILSNNYAVAQSEKGRFSDARNHIGEAIRIAGLHNLANDESQQLKRNASHIMVSEAKAALEKRKRSRAVSLLKEALTLHRDNVSALNLLGKTYYEDNKTELARQCFNRAAKIKPDNQDLKKMNRKLEVEVGVEEDFSSSKRGLFQVDFGGQDQSESARKALSILKRASNRISRELGLRPKSLIVVKIYTDDQYKAVTDAPNWSSGVYDGRIRIRSSELGRSEEYLERVLSHEFCHALLTERVGKNLPSWFQEGLAQMVEPGGEKSSAAYTLKLRKRARAASLVGLDQMQTTFIKSPNQQTARLLYAESLSFVLFLKKKHRASRMRRLLDLLAAGSEWERAWKTSYGKELSSLEADWIESLKM